MIIGFGGTTWIGI